MCNHCGCSSDQVRVFAARGQDHHHLKRDDTTRVKLERSLVAANELEAEQNRRWLRARKITCINLMGTPGAGKTRLLEASIPALLAHSRPLGVLEGDQETQNDAERVRALGVKAAQINTGTGCHLDASMLRAGLDSLNPEPGALVFVENVGNLVCPALFDLGERLRVTVMAVTDGDDKPEKYPHMFAASDLVLVNKADLLPYLEFDLDKVKQTLARLNPKCALILLSASKGDGIADWLGWLDGHGRSD